MLGPLTRISNYAGRNYMRNFVRNGSHGGIPGEVSDAFFSLRNHWAPNT